MAIFWNYNLPQYLLQTNGNHSGTRKKKNEIGNVANRTLTPLALFDLEKWSIQSKCDKPVCGYTNIYDGTLYPFLYFSIL